MKCRTRKAEDVDLRLDVAYARSLTVTVCVGSTEHPNAGGTGTSHPGSARSSASCSLASSRDSSTCTTPYRVLMMGTAGVGKSSLVQQFMTSEYLQAYDLSLGEWLLSS